MLAEGAVEGAQGGKADQRADLCDRVLAAAQKAASVCHAQRVDVVVKAYVKLGVQRVGYVKFAYMKISFYGRERYRLIVIFLAIAKNHSKSFYSLLSVMMPDWKLRQNMLAQYPQAADV